MRNAGGSDAGASSANTLNAYAAPVPSPIRLNMLRFHERNDAHARSKNGLPHQSTTGVASAACIQLSPLLPIQRAAAKAGLISLIASTTSGIVNKRLTRNRRAMSSSSV